MDDKEILLLHGQDYRRIYNSCRESKTYFVDSEFPPDNSSLFKVQSLPFQVEWRRVEELSNSPHLFCHDNGSLDNNVIQGAVGNCWLVSALGVLQTHPKLLDRVIPKWSQQEWSYRNKLVEYHPGVFRFRFYRFGHWIEVVVDSLLPVFVTQNAHGTRLVYAHSQNPDEFWCALLEKAYAKLCGGYEALESGSASDALVDLTGTVPEQLNLCDPKTRREFGIDGVGGGEWFFNMMKGAMLKEALMSCSIAGEEVGAQADERLENGLIVGHAYGITDLRRIRASWWRRFFKHPPDTLLVRLHNPWGEGEWNGPWSDDSKEWRAVPKARKKQLGVKIADDGDFWMSFPDFSTNFTSLIVCRDIPTNNNHLRLFQRHRWRSAVFISRWSLADNTAGGCVNYPQSFPKNHQYIFTIRDPAVCVISLMQQDSRRNRHLGAENATIGFVVLRVERNRRFRFHKSMYEVIAKVTYMNSREVSGRFKLPPGRYVCVPTTFDPAEEGDFFLRMFFSCRRFVYVKELKTDGPTPPLWWRIPRSVFLQDEERRNLYYYDGFVKISIVSAELNPPRGKQIVTVPLSTSTSTTFSPDQLSTDGTSQTQSTVPVFVKNFECYALLAFMDLKTKRWVRNFQTRDVSDTLNPTFNEDFLHYVRDPRRIGVVVQLWQRGPLGQDRFMGEIRIALDKYTDERKQGKTWEVQRTLTKLRGFSNSPKSSGGPGTAAQTAWRGWETVNCSSRNSETSGMASFSRRSSSAYDSRSNLTRSAPPFQQAPRLMDSAIGQVTRANATGGLTRSPPPQPPIIQVMTPELQVESIAEHVTRSNNGTMAGKTLNPLLLPPPSVESSIAQVTRAGHLDENRLQAGSVRSRASRTSSRLSGVHDNGPAAPIEQPRMPSPERRASASTKKRKEKGAGELKIRITYVRDRGQGLIEE